MRTADEIWTELRREANEWTRETGLVLKQYVMSCEDYETIVQDVKTSLLRYSVYDPKDDVLYVYLNNAGKTKLIPWP